MIIYDLETRIRKQRKQLAAQACKSWTMVYDTITGEYFTFPNLTKAQIRATRLPSKKY